MADGPSISQMIEARMFTTKNEVDCCDACTAIADVHIIATRADTGEAKTIKVCKQHMLDPGPLLDY